MPPEFEACLKHVKAIQAMKSGKAPQNNSKHYIATEVVGRTPAGKPVEKVVCKDNSGTYAGESFVPKESSIAPKKAISKKKK